MASRPVIPSNSTRMIMLAIFKNRPSERILFMDQSPRYVLAMLLMTRRTKLPSAATIFPVHCSRTCGGATSPIYYEPRPRKKVALANYPKGGSTGPAGAAGLYFWHGLLWLAMLMPLNLRAAG